MMQIKRVLFLIVVVATFFSCTTGEKVSSVKQSADQAWENKDYTVALIGYEQIISKYKAEGRTDECPAYGRAGIAAFNVNDVPKAIDYLKMDTYTSFASAEAYWALAQCYRKIDNLSKEIMALNDYVKLFSDGSQIVEVQTRLFETSVESENWDLAVELWPVLPDDVKNIELLSMWFTVNLALGNDEKCNIQAIQILKADPNNIPALEWQAKSIYQKAEQHYQNEMDAYEKNKTNKQYKRLLTELDLLTAKFQSALDIYEKLYELDPKSTYAQYMSNIYVRFNDKEKAEYYRKKAGQ